MIVRDLGQWYIFIPFSEAALTAFIFAVPLILYICEFDPKPPTHDICVII